MFKKNHVCLDSATVSLIHNHVKVVTGHNVFWGIWKDILPEDINEISLSYRGEANEGVRKWLGAAYHILGARWSGKGISFLTPSRTHTLYILPSGKYWLEDAIRLQENGVRVVVLNPGEVCWVDREGTSRHWCLDYVWSDGSFEMFHLNLPRPSEPEKNTGAVKEPPKQGILGKIASFWGRRPSPSLAG